MVVINLDRHLTMVFHLPLMRESLKSWTKKDNSSKPSSRTTLIYVKSISKNGFKTTNLGWFKIDVKDVF